MERPGFRDLIGRAMIDREFLAALLRDPAEVLLGFELESEERAAVLRAVERATSSVESERARAFQAVIMKRWAT